jgi:hypothetical protein
MNMSVCSQGTEAAREALDIGVRTLGAVVFTFKATG